VFGHRADSGVQAVLELAELQMSALKQRLTICGEQDLKLYQGAYRAWHELANAINHGPYIAQETQDGPGS